MNIPFSVRIVWLLIILFLERPTTLRITLSLNSCNKIPFSNSFSFSLQLPLSYYIFAFLFISFSLLSLSFYLSVFLFFSLTLSTSLSLTLERMMTMICKWNSSNFIMKIKLIKYLPWANEDRERGKSEKESKCVREREQGFEVFQYTWENNNGIWKQGKGRYYGGIWQQRERMRQEERKEGLESLTLLSLQYLTINCNPLVSYITRSI